MTDRAPTTPEFTILIDGACPLCKREADLMRRMDKGRGKLAIVDIADPAFDPSVYGKSYDDVMGSIHGVLASGEIISGMEVFRKAYAAVGYGWALAPTGWPIIRPIADAAYSVFARIRLKLPGRSCDAGSCRVR